MKKLLLNVLSFMSAGILVYAQNNEGMAIYQMTIEGLPPEQASMMGDMEMKMIWKDNKVYSEQSSMMYNVKSVTDDKGTLVLMDQMGNKMYWKSINDPKKEEKQPTVDYNIEYANETKKIAGYDCKKAIVTVKGKDGEHKVDIWYTEQIPNHYAKHKSNSKRDQGSAYLKAIKGMPLEYSMPQGQMTIKITAKEINFNPISNDIFNLSTEGYKEIDPSMMKGKQ